MLCRACSDYERKHGDPRPWSPPTTDSSLANGWLGIDVGWVFPAADSDGNIYQWRRLPQVERVKLVPAGPVTIRRADGSVEVRDPYDPVSASEALARGQGANLARISRVIVTHAQKTNRGIALENWVSFSRRKAAWIKMWRAIESKASMHDVPVTQVNRAYTSLTCPKCGFRGRENRPTRDRFACVRCQFSGHADVIAAMNIAARAAGLFVSDQGRCTNPTCDRPVWRAGLCSGCYRYKRRVGVLPAVEDLDSRRGEADLEYYRRQMRLQALREREQRENKATTERMRRSWATHDAWGNPLPGLANDTSVT